MKRIFFSQRSKVIAHDVVAISAAWLLALAARFNFSMPPEAHLSVALNALPLVLLVQALVARHFRLYRGLWRFASLQDLWNIVRAAVLGVVGIGLSLFVANRLEGIPRSMLILYPVFLVLLLGGPRLFYRLWKDHALDLRRLDAGPRALIIGAGSGGEDLLRDMRRTGNYDPVGFLDDNPSLLKQRIHGVPVIGAVEELPALAARHQVELILIAIPSATNETMQRIVKLCAQTGVPFRTLPRLAEVATGRQNSNALREVLIDDLLGRASVELDWQVVQGALAGKVVLVTGGGGSIGAELCRQIARLGITKLIIFERAEHHLYLIEQEFQQHFGHIDSAFVLGDVCDEVALAHAFATFKPQIVFHAAAYKHVPIVEGHVREGARNNVIGTANVAAQAVKFRCETFVLISTDKAVRPSSVMGATKRFAELLCQAQDQHRGTRFITVRFGNVLGSAGSVIPLFKRQIEAGGPVTITHPDATRFFMTISEACQLILQAAANGRGGEIFVLDMGDPVNITELARQLIHLTGTSAEREIEIVYTGLRPGEKLNEELFRDDENLSATRHKKILLAAPSQVDSAQVDAHYQQLVRACDAFEETEIRRALAVAVPELGEMETEIAGQVVKIVRSQ